MWIGMDSAGCNHGPGRGLLACRQWDELGGGNNLSESGGAGRFSGSFGDSSGETVLGDGDVVGVGPTVSVVTFE